jgi:Flp pilus assembly protein TadD
VWRQIAEAATGRREHRAAVEAYRKASAVEPRDASLLNALGYAAASAGDLQAATEH